MKDDAYWAEHRRVRAQLRRQGRANFKAGSGFQTTIGAIAKSVRLPIERVHEHLKNGYLIIVSEDETKPMADWIIEEDGV